MESTRQEKFGRQLQRDLADIFQKDTHHFFGNALVTITGVSVSPDLGLARTYLSVFPISETSRVFDHLDAVKSEIRHKLGKKIGSRVRIVPELVFFHDDTQEQASKMDNIIGKLDIKPEDEKE